MIRLLASILVIFMFSCNSSDKQTKLKESIKINTKYKLAREPSLNFVGANETTLSEEIEIKSGSGSSDDPYHGVLHVKNQTDSLWEGVILIELESLDKEARFFLPGYMYGTNNGNKVFNPKLIKQYQRLNKDKKEPPYSPYWFLRSDQLSHPVATMFSGGKMLGISASPILVKEGKSKFWLPGISKDSLSAYNGFYVSLEKNPAVGFTVGYLDAPGSYISPWEYEEFNKEKQGAVKIPANEEIAIPFKVYAFDAPDEASLSGIIRDVYEEYHESPRKDNTAQNAIHDITSAVYHDAYSPQNETYGLISKKPSRGPQNTLQGGGGYELNNKEDDSYSYNFEGLIAWTNGSVIGVPLLQASYILEKPELREQALSVLDNIVTSSINPENGIPFCTKKDGKWTNKGWWTDWVESEGVNAEHSSYIVGQALYYILKAYDVELKNSENEFSDYLYFVEGVLNIVKDSQNEAGAFPRFWSESSGKGSQYDAFSGCWIAAAMAYHAQLTGKTDYLDAAKKAEAFYYTDVQRMECTTTPLDVADAPDSEGILAYIRLAKILHEITGEIKFLEHLKMGLDYELTYKFCYNVPVTAPPLNKTDWSSSGGSITSVCNAVLHCMSNSILDETNYYYQKSGDDYYKSRMLDTYYWGLQTYNREANEFFFGKKGWSTEYFCQAERYVLDIRLADGTRSNIWLAYHPWATAAILEGMVGELWDIKME